MKTKAFTLTLLILSMFSIGLVAAQTLYVNADYAEERNVMVTGADRLVETQNDNGKWEWTNPNTDKTDDLGSSNTMGVTAMGLLSAYEVTGNESYLNAAIITGEKGIIERFFGTASLIANNVNDNERQNAFDILFLYKLGELSENSRYTNAADALFENVLSQTNYWETHNGNYCDSNGCTAQELYDAYLNLRGSDDGIIFWDLAPFIEAAEYGIYGDFISDLQTVIESEYTKLDENDTRYILGLSGVLAATGNTSVANVLLDSQDEEDGSWYSDPQDTAYVVIALNRYDYEDAAKKGIEWLADNQGENGGWFYGTTEYTEVSSEAIWSIRNVIYEEDTYYTIQDAIEAAEDDNIIHVKSGEYVEDGQIIIDKNLSIVGNGRNEVIIKPNHTTAINNRYSDTTGWFYVLPSKSFSLTGVTLNGEGQIIAAAVQSAGESTIKDCIIKNIKSAQYYGTGIRLLDGSNNLVENVEFSNIERIGVHVRGSIKSDNPYALINNITYAGKGSGAFLDYGVEFGGGGQGVVNNSYFSDVRNSTSAWSSSAILATVHYGPGTAAIVENNVFENNMFAIQFGYPDDEDDDTAMTVHYNKFINNTYNFDNDATGSNVTADIRYNYWGTNDESEIKEKIWDQEGYIPYYTNAEMTKLSIGAPKNDSSGNLIKEIEEELNLTQENITVQIPSKVNVTTDNSTWDGTIQAPTITTPTNPTVSGYTTTARKTIQVGYPGIKLTFDKAVKLVIPGEAGDNILVGYTHDGTTFTPITTKCQYENNQTWADNMTTEDCYYSNTTSGDLTIWTKHFTEFTTYTQTAVVTDNNNNNNGGGGGSSIPVKTTNETNQTNQTEELPQSTVELNETESESIITRGTSAITGAVTGAAEKVSNVNRTYAAAGFVGVLLLLYITSFVFFGGILGTSHMKRAAVFHKRAQKAHIKGKYTKASKLYDKSYALREKAEQKAFGRSRDGTI